MCSFAHIRNEGKLSFLDMQKISLFTPLKTRNKERNNIEDAKFYQIKKTFRNN